VENRVKEFFSGHGKDKLNINFDYRKNISIIIIQKARGIKNSKVFWLQKLLYIFYLKYIFVLGSHQLKTTLDELRSKKLDLLAMKTKDFKIGKIQEFLFAMRARKEGGFL
jgi:hypothetical protein